MDAEFFFGLLCALVGMGVAFVIPLVSLVLALRTQRAIRALEARIDTLEAYRVPQARPEPFRSAAPDPRPSPSPTPAAPPPEPPSTAPLPTIELPPAPRADTPATPQEAPSVATAVGDSRTDPPLAAQPPPAAPPPPPRLLRPASPSLPPPETLAVWVAAVLFAVMLVGAALFGLREAIERGYVSPAVRFAAGISIGVGAWALAEFLRPRDYRVPAAALAGGGSAVLYAALWAGHARYGVIGNPVAFGAMVATTGVTMFAAARQRNLFLAILALAGGYLTPILLATGENKAVAFFSYLALLNAGIVWAALRRPWFPAILLAGMTTAALHVGWGASFRAPDQVLVALAASIGHAALFFVLPARRSTPTAEAAAGAIAGLLMLLAGAAFIVPADPLHYDPVSVAPLRWSLGGTAWLAASWVTIASAVAMAVAVRREWVPLRVVTVGVAGLLGAVFAFGWSFAGEPQHAAVVAGLLGMVAAGVVAPWRARPWESIPLFVVAGVCGAVMAAPVGFGALPTTEAPLLVLSVGLVLAMAAVAYGADLRVALVAGLVAAFLPLYPNLTERIAGGSASWMFATAAFAYAVVAFPPLLRPRSGDLPGTLAAALAGPVAFFLFYDLWDQVLGDSFIGLLAVLLGAPTLLGASTLVRTLGARADSRELALLVVVTLLFAAVAVPLQLEEAWLTVGWALEVALLAALTRRLSHPGIQVFAVVLAVAVSIRLLLNDEAWRYGGGEGLIILNWTLYTWGIPGVCFLLAAGWWQGPSQVATGLRVAAVLIFFALVNAEVGHAFARDDQLSFVSENFAESMTRSIAWGAYGLFLIVANSWRESRAGRFGGFAFLLLAVAKVALFDVWNLSGFVRVGSLAGLALVLLIAAVAFQRIVLRERKP